MPATSPAYIAGGNVSPCRFVKISDNYTVSQAGAGETCAGVSAEGHRYAPIPEVTTNYAAIAGDPIRVHGDGETCLLELGGTVTAGAMLKSDADGKGVAASATDEAGAKAIEGGVSGAKIHVQVLTQKA